jgi:indolepyruvate ferredoxin oxidoreductase
MACDPIVTAYEDTLGRMLQGRTNVALNTHIAPTSKFIQNPDWQFPKGQCDQLIAQAVGENAIARVDAENLASKVMGDSLYTNPIMLGFAWQKGWIPLTKTSLIRAIELNGVQIDANKRAFELGRYAAQYPDQVTKLITPDQAVQWVKSESLEHMVKRRVEFLTAYQNKAYADRYEIWVRKIEQAEKNLGHNTHQLSKAVAKYLFKLMSYKDEYEVARLHTDTQFLSRVKSMFDGPVTLKYNLAPPTFSSKNEKGELVKKEFGSYMLPAFRVLSKLKFLRGTAFDVFGYTHERKTERQLIADYEKQLDVILNGLTSSTLPLAIELASIPEHIRGYGHVKEAHLAKAKVIWDEKRALWGKAN